MDLNCPHCQQRVTVSDQLAGQVTNCPSCRGPFMVPRADTASPAAPPPSPQSPGTIPMQPEPVAAAMPVQSAAPAWTPPAFPEPSAPAPPPTPAWSPPPEPPITGDYTRRMGCQLRPQVVKWITPVCLIVIFFMMLMPFLPWVGVYGGSQYMQKQSGAGVAFGGYTAPLKESDEAKKENKVGAAPLTILYFFLVIIGFLMVIALVVLPQVNPQLAHMIMSWRGLAMMAITTLALLFLILQLLIGFPLERKYAELFDKGADEISKLKEEDRVKAEFERGLAHDSLDRRFWLRLTVILNVLAVLASFADLWLQRRVGKPHPRFQVEW